MAQMSVSPRFVACFQGGMDNVRRRGKALEGFGRLSYVAFSTILRFGAYLQAH